MAALVLMRLVGVARLAQIVLVFGAQDVAVSGAAIGPAGIGIMRTVTARAFHAIRMDQQNIGILWSAVESIVVRRVNDAIGMAALVIRMGTVAADIAHGMTILAHGILKIRRA